MSNSLRRRLLAGTTLMSATGLVLAGCGGGPATTGSGPAAAETPSLVADPTAPSLDELYQQARAEGGALTVWAGGDAPNQADWIKQAFEKRFPGVTANITVDLSKFNAT